MRTLWLSICAISFSMLIIPSMGIASPEALPSAFDLREKLGGLSPVRNQGTCGSCWAFASTAALETAIKMKEGLTVTLSAQQVLSCNGKGYSCSGGFVDALDLLVLPGLSLESDYPYTGQSDPCVQNTPIFRRASRWSKVLVNPGSETATDADIKKAVYQYGAVFTGMGADEALMSYSSGIFNTCKMDQINKAVNIVGWNDEGGYWIVRNTWGDSWGEKGYARVKYGCNGIGAFASYIEYDPKAQD